MVIATFKHAGPAFDEITPEQFDDALHANATGPFLLARAAAEELGSNQVEGDDKIAKIAEDLKDLEAIVQSVTPELKEQSVPVERRGEKIESNRRRFGRVRRPDMNAASTL